MANILENHKGFKVIQCTAVEIMQLGCVSPVCDYCNSAAFEGYYIAVLNCWYCSECYAKWMERARWYQEDSHIEERNFMTAKMRMGL